MLYKLTLEEAAKGLKEKKFSSTELTSNLIERAKKLNPTLNAYVTFCEDKAMAGAKAADERIAMGQQISDLDGIPAGLKDNFNTKGVRTTCCSPILKNFVPPYSATAVDRLEKAGLVLIGKTNLDEYACGGSTEHSCFGPTRNPWGADYISGGSSGGSAAAVAADMSFYSTGTDTGGSIRQPASLCGCVGLKVTYGRVSRSGITAMASSWDTVGPFGKTVRDVARVLQVMAGRDDLDSTTPDVPVPNYIGEIDKPAADPSKPLSGLKIGVPKEYYGEGIDPAVEAVVRSALKEYEKLGATIHDVSLPFTKYAVAVYYVAMPAELSANLARFDGIRYGSKPKEEAKDLVDYYYQARSEGFGDEIKRRIMIGTYVLSAGYYDAYYKKAQRVRTLICRDFDEAFKGVDVMLTPVSPFPAWKVGEKIDDPLKMYLADALTIPSSCAGVPALSIPCGFVDNKDTGAAKLPVGMQIIAPQFREDLLLRVGNYYEQATEWHKQKPGL
ncbi:MAG TPA: Asp-tRNA(Asn)/Glu-tRNA(Gln) amidotransferase subunit GatA [Candidatus Gracilibacteria bacterium]|nr:Asp-tRNA(Asn)/Glu-tRNA(Gln) amidotransferase subunit GatA [Candidatus Gracilibacteria bacterium]HRY91153.1 Asp-tRNA(Asn)/Glu-tRNA(Gln) amidotransferase subunit GatA [Candidatus Gracilibacteria bacterium]